jgi:hypothetical protein
MALAVTVEGTRDILGPWAGDGGEGAKFWLQVHTELKKQVLDELAGRTSRPGNDGRSLGDRHRGQRALAAGSFTTTRVERESPPSGRHPPGSGPGELSGTSLLDERRA